MIQLPLISTLFPYTTLFRSNRFQKILLSLITSLIQRPNIWRIGKYLLTKAGTVDFYHKSDVWKMRRFLFAFILLLLDRKSTRLNSSHVRISYAVFCLKKKNK